MNARSETGRIVWHDLITNDVARATRFYATLLGWQFRVEHAEEFAWTGHEADYPLIIANGEAHGGFVNPGRTVSPTWLVYVSVEDVDATVASARALGATISWGPFDVPGVGRNAVIVDPQGAMIGAYASAHEFPPPHGTFVWDSLVTDDLQPAKLYYGRLFGWEIDDTNTGGNIIFKRANSIGAAGAVKGHVGLSGTSHWLTYIATSDVDATVVKARALGAHVEVGAADVQRLGRCALLTDPTGAPFGLLTGAGS